MLCFRDRICEKGRFGKDRGGFYDGHYAIGEAERPAHTALLVREGFAELGGKRRSLAIRKTYASGREAFRSSTRSRTETPSPSHFASASNSTSAWRRPFISRAFWLEGKGERELDPAAECGAEGLLGLRLSNLAKEEKIEARSDRAFILAHSPVRSSSMYQGCLLLLGFDLDLSPDSSQRLSLTLEIRS
jgi:hypothetical protein